MQQLNVVVLMQSVPDLVDELEIDPDSGLLDRTFMRLIPNEMDEHALEEALLLKERHGAHVTVIAPDAGEVEEVLYTAIAKGADRAVKLVGNNLDQRPTNLAMSALLDQVIEQLRCDVLLVGTQAVDDLDASVGSCLAARRGIPYVGYVISVAPTDEGLLVAKEFPGGLIAEIETDLPAIIGIQAAEQPPRYVVTTLVTQAMKNATLDEIEVAAVDDTPAVPDLRMRAPEAGARAEMIDGTVEEIADRLVELFESRELIG